MKHRILRALETSPMMKGRHGMVPINTYGVNGGGGEQTTSSEPWGPQQNALRGIYGAAGRQFGQGPQEYFPDSTVAPMSNYTQSAIEGLGNFGGGKVNQFLARSGKDAIQALGYGGKPTLESGKRLNPQAEEALQSVYGNEAFANIMPKLRASVGDPRQADTYSGQTFDEMGSNPYTDQLVRKVMEANTENFTRNVVPRIEGQAIADNGFGGSRQALAEGLAAGELGNTNSRAATEIYQTQYNQDVANKLQAANQADSAGVDYTRSIIDQFNTGNNIAGTQNQNQTAAAGLGLDMLLKGFGQAQDGVQSAANLLPAFQRMGLMGDTAKLEAGQYMDDYTQRMLSDEVNRWNFGQQAPWDNIMNYANAVSGNPGGTTTAPGPGTGGQILGGAATGAGLFGGLTTALGASAPAFMAAPWALPLFAGGGALMNML